MKTWLKLALLHEAAHAWAVTEFAERAAIVIIPAPDTGEDTRCEWNTGDSVEPSVAAIVTLAGLAAELEAGIPEDVAYRNAEDDLATMSAIGMFNLLEPLLSQVRNLVREDANTITSLVQEIAAAVEKQGLPLRYTYTPGHQQVVVY